MKLLYCPSCEDIISPYGEKKNYMPRACQCNTFEVWWINPLTGELGIRDNSWNKEEHQHWQKKAIETGGKCWVFGLHNGFISMSGSDAINKNKLQELLDDTPDNYLFKSSNSLIVKIFPGFTSDVKMFPQDYKIER